jgi:hypothetical protein
MTPAGGLDRASIPPPSYHRTLATSLHLDALTLVTRLDLLALCRLAAGRGLRTGGHGVDRVVLATGV